MNRLLSLEDVEKSMQQFIDERFLGQPFFKTLLQGEWTAHTLHYFAWQYAHYSANFPRILGAAISAMAPEDDWWIPLADNLWDEAGRGIPGHSHAVLYRTFLESVDPKAHKLYDNRQKWPSMGPSVSQAVKDFINFFYKATPLEAMAAVGLGSEFFADQIMGTIGQGLRHPQYQQKSSVNTTFWEVHARHDEPRHYALCRTVLLKETPADSYQHILEIGQYIAGSEASMYDGIYQEALSHGI
ncbi:TenA family transcriptional regulator [Sulfobacillus thermosulfidooxidans]|uniref:TenA family transcriptional regulator n=1 Tax=Sulfobacillus thermosulfidooxidans TaxID=28034 RepID=UPI0006B67BC5|nr:iron-containing redox enzyme family protein [Sulfobacillus thermosulfidooxidans]